MTAAVLKQTICARAGNENDRRVSHSPRRRDAHASQQKNLSRAFRDVHGAHHTDGDHLRPPSAPMHPTRPSNGQTKKNSPIIARCDRDAHRARARRLAYRVDVRTHGPIRANGHVALRDLSRDDRDARQSRALEKSIARIKSYRVSRARVEIESNRGRVVPLRRESRASGRILGRWTPWR